ncbi:MAG TPA: hypothetical protein VGO16_07490 [Pseudonocardiaceae bacterium]|nr:hypothetical protein [Pseudonocardiaceae bacterium]
MRHLWPRYLQFRHLSNPGRTEARLPAGKHAALPRNRVTEPRWIWLAATLRSRIGLVVGLLLRILGWLPELR